MSSRSTDAFGAWQEYGVDLRRRRVMFHYPMFPAEESHHIGVEHVIRNLLFLDHTKGPIELWLNCPGGETVEMWALYDLIRSCQNQVDIVAFGNVCSAGCLVLAGGTGTRWVTPNCQFMWHQGTSGVDGGQNYLDAQHRAEFEKTDFDRWVKTMAKHTKKPANFWSAKSKGELWLWADGMIEYGVADQIWDPDDE